MTEKLTLSELQYAIRDSLYISFPEMYWIVAEISEIKENYAGHCYLELIEKQNDEKNIKARIRAVVWCKRYNFIKSCFQNFTGEILKPGLKILVKARIEYHELYGLSLDISDIDPSYTIGELSAKRQKIIRQLENEGVFEMNKELDLPLSIRRIAVISSSSAAGYSDFMNHLSQNEFGYIFYTKLFESPMQGHETEQGIVRALDMIAENQDNFDAVVIIRGGGSQTDLGWFDSYNIAYHITQFPLPVITGIGHDKDMSVTDMVACKALKTPTAVAGFIIDTTAAFEKRLQELWSGIQKATIVIIEKNRKIIEYSGIKLLPLTRIMMSEVRSVISDRIIRLVSVGTRSLNKTAQIISGNKLKFHSVVKTLLVNKREYINTLKSSMISSSQVMLSSKKKHINSAEKNLELLKPENILRRGYTITHKNGTIVKSIKMVNAGEIIQTLFADGNVSSTINKERINS
ncbi:MAG TPA: exodeoxyribonuclease VII large subunit [Bacteroidales bacterium]|nr:exodeoxyribonuclease VII large subunit [Bacteroidales bacterium]